MVLLMNDIKGTEHTTSQEIIKAIRRALSEIRFGSVEIMICTTRKSCRSSAKKRFV